MGMQTDSADVVTLATLAGRFVVLDDDDVREDEAQSYWDVGTDLFGAEAWVQACDRALRERRQGPVGELEGDSPTGSVITSTPEEQ